ncbi:Kiwa anti-phage protein KwaB-like domain-containing protein [Escherichia coli]
MELFAITDSEIPTRIIKIDIDAPAQTVVENLFRTQRSEFINEDIEEIEFCASYNVQDGEIFSINPFDDEIGIINAIERPDAVPVWDPDDVSVHYFKALFTGEPASNGNPTQVWLQCFDRRQIINNEKSFFQVVTQPGNRFSVSTRPGFSLSDRLTAILVGDKLLFKSFFMLRRFFNMEEYFNEATREDLGNFIGNDIFHVENAEDFMMFADSAIKKKVSLIISSGILNDQPIENLIECAQKIGYQLGITNVNGDNKITMPNSKREVKQLLYFLDQGYFNSIITNELMLTNSKRPIRI